MLGFLIIATGNYYKYLSDLIKSIEKFYPKNISKKYYIFSNHDIKLEFIENYEIIFFEHKPFPSSTLFRFHQFEKIKNKLIEETESLCYIDADSLIVRSPPQEIFTEDLYGFEHGVNLTNNFSSLPYERNSNSLSYVANGQEKKYIIGGLWGGKTKKLINMFSVLKKNIDKDLENGIIACFHDESHINKYFCDNLDVKIFETKYIMGEIDSYNKKNVWQTELSLEECRHQFVNNDNQKILLNGNFFAIFLEKNHFKERLFLGNNEKIYLK